MCDEFFPGNVFHDRIIGDCERLPSLKVRVPRGYNWRHSKESAVKSQDWTRITRLELTNMWIRSFLTILLPHHLIHLKELMLDDRCECGQDVTTNMTYELISQIRALKVLSIKCSTQKPATAIKNHGATLRYPCMKGYNIPHSPQWTYLSKNQLVTIRNSCKNLMELSLDINISSYPTIAALSTRCNLRRLTVKTRTQHHVLAPIEKSRKSCNWYVR